MDRRSEMAKRPGHFAWVPQFLWFGQQRIRTQIRLLGLAMLVGVVAGFGAIVFFVATRAVEHYALGVVVGYDAKPRPAGEAEMGWLPPIGHPLNPWLLLVIPTVGGLLSGVLVFSVAPEAEGHGTDAVIAAYHLRQGQIRPRVPLVKIVASALTLGSGGSGGREGPIAQIGAGFGSLLSNVLRLRTSDRRVLMAAGMGAGIAAIFRAPLAGALFAAEVLYSSPEFEAEVIIPAAIASVTSYCTFGIFAGWQPLFSIPDNLSFRSTWELGPYSLLVLLSVVMAALYTRTFYGCVGLFHRLPLRAHFRPAVGAFLTGAVALLLYFVVGGQQQVLAVLSFGYSALQGAMSQETAVSAWVLLAIALGKTLTTGLTIGSGGSGGVFGPSMVIGGCGGGALGLVLHSLWPTLVPHPATFVIMGMAGFFAAAAKTPFSTLVIVSEMTGGYRLLLPALWVCSLSYILSDKRSIYSSQVEGRSRSPAHQGSYVREVLAGAHVRQFLKEPLTPVLHPDDPLDKVVGLMTDAPYAILPVVAQDRRLLGVVGLEDLQLVLQATHVHNLILAEDLMRSDVRPLTPDDTLDRALELFVENDLLILPVVESLGQQTLLGMVPRSEISRVYIRRIQGPPPEKSA